MNETMVARDPFNIYVEQLRNGNHVTIDEEVPPNFLDVNEKELFFTGTVSIQGETYLAGDSLIFHLALIAHGVLPCTICNQPVQKEIDIVNFYHAEPVEELRGGIFNFKEVVREAILLEVPAFAECQGECPKRKELKKYLKPSEKKAEEEGYHPFKDL